MNVIVAIMLSKMKPRRSRALAFLCVVFSLVFGATAQATNYSENSFEYFSKSDSNSAFIDLHMQKVKRFVLISGDIITPIELSDGESIKLMASNGYTPQSGGYNSYQVWSGESFQSSSVDSSNEINVFIGDFNGDGHQDQLLQSAKGSVSSSLADQTLIIVYGSDSSLPLKIETVSAIVTSEGFNIGRFNASAALLAVGDFNGDGISDIELTSTNSEPNHSPVQVLAFGNSQGIEEIKWEPLSDQSIMPVPNTDGVLTSIPNIAMPIAPSSNTIGLTVAGQANVSPTGSASYAVPIAVSPALSGLQPSISVQYNSHSILSPTPIKLSQIHPGTGSMGLGWSIAGLSSISRCLTDLTRDTAVDAIDYDDNDQFCLDGQRLILIGGTHGSSGAEYRTELNSNARIFSESVAATGTQSFKVIGSNGSIAVYGGTTDSRQEALGRDEIDRWNVSEIRDGIGNLINFNYEKNKDIDNLTYRVSAITYEDKEVTFSYLNSNTFENGTLQAIHSSERTYTFEYEQSVNDSSPRLVSIKKCIDALCIDPLQFSWNQSEYENGSEKYGNYKSAMSAFGIDAGGWKVETHPRMMADINGDGLDDIIGFGGNGVDTALSNGNGTFGTYQRTDSIFGSNSGSGGWKLDTHIRTMADVNGDGLQDIVGFAGDGVLIALSDGKGKFVDYDWAIMAYGSSGTGGWDNERHLRTLADVNGDGLPDIVGFGGNGVDTSINNGDGTFATPQRTENVFGYNDNAGSWRMETHPRMMADINGDGLSDIIGFAGVGVRTMLADGTGKFINYQTAIGSFGSSGEGGWDIAKHPRMMADINGDGMADIIGFGGNGVDVAFAQGDGTFSGYKRAIDAFGSNSEVGGWKLDTHVRAMTDINGDGLQDIIGFAGDGVITALSDGKGNFVDYGWAIKAFGSSGTGGWDNERHPRMLADVNGDGLRDIVGFASAGVITAVSKYATGVISTVTNEQGIQAAFNYQDSVITSAYDKGDSHVVYPAMPGSEGGHPEPYLANSGNIITSISSDNGQGGTNSTSYQYEGLKTHLLGLGSLGFAKQVMTEDQTGTKTITEHAQDPDNRLVGLTTSSKVIASNGVELSASTSDWESQGSNGSTFRVKLRKFAIQKKSLSGINTQKNETYYCVTDTENCTAQSTSYDTYGNQLYIKSIDTGQQNGGETFITQTNNEYWPINSFSTNSDDFNVSQMKKSTVVKSGSLRAAKTRVGEFNEYYATGRLKKETVDPGTAQLVTEYEYNGSYGRMNKKTVSGTGVETRSNNVYFDVSNPYIITNTNELGHSTTTEISPLWGSILSKTDVNGITARFAYDDFGRLQIQASPDGGLVEVKYKNCDVTCPSNAVFYKQTTGSDGISSSVSKTYVDALRRTVATSSLSFDGREVRVDYLYDSLGRQYKTSLPYFVGGSETVKYTENTQYDILNRVTEMTHPNTSTSRIVYNGLSTDFYNSENQKTVTVKNALGETIISTDDNLKLLQQEYDALGNLVKTTDEAGNSVVMNYNIRGNKISMTDPDKGHWVYKYTALGQLVTETDAKNQTSCMAYDILGRMRKRIDNYASTYANALDGCVGDESNTQTATWEYDTSPLAGIGKLHRITNAKGYSKEFSYDALGRVVNSATTMPRKSVSAWGEEFTYEGKTYHVGQTYYANTTKVENKLYPSYNGEAFTTKSRYNPRGFLYQTQDAITNTAYWTANEYNARGQITESTLGNGVATSNVFNSDTGMIETIDSVKGGSTIQYLEYHYSDMGNLEYRYDDAQNIQETFDYDDINRLIGSTVTGSTHNENHTFTYDTNGLGNIKTKTGVGTYLYGQPSTGCSIQFAGPHAVTSITGGAEQAATNYCYNQNGDMVSGAGRSISYTAFGKPSLMSKGDINKVEFTYGANRNRIHRIDNDLTTTTYVDGIYEEMETSGVLSGRYYIGNYAVVSKESSSSNTRYMHHDHLGSVDAITNEVGTVVDRMSFDVWGKRRNSQTWNNSFDLFNFTTELTPRGYTGHEHVDSMGLIHMNGRVYDPILARFISADPLIQAPDDMQSYNRYSYVRNNPLAYTDPSGYSWLGSKLKQFDKWVTAESDRFARRNNDLSNALYAVALASFGQVGQGYGYIHGTKHSQTYRFMSSAVAGKACGSPCVALNAYAQTKILGGSDEDAFKSAVVAYLSSEATQDLGKGEIGGAGDIASRSFQRGVVGAIHAKALGGDPKKGFALSATMQLVGDSFRYFIEQRNLDANGNTVAKNVAPNPLPGSKGADFNKFGKYDVMDGERINIGESWDGVNPPKGYDIDNIKLEGSKLMLAANVVPGMNYMSAFHDSFSLSGGWNVATIFVAMPMTWYMFHTQAQQNDYMLKSAAH